MEPKSMADFLDTGQACAVSFTGVRCTKVAQYSATSGDDCGGTILSASG